MPLHPLARAFLELPFIKAMKPLHTLSVEEARKEFTEQGKFMPPGEPVAQVEDLTIPGPDADIPVRIYRPGGAGPFPIFVNLHGFYAGGFMRIRTWHRYHRLPTQGLWPNQQQLPLWH